MPSSRINFVLRLLAVVLFFFIVITVAGNAFTFRLKDDVLRQAGEALASKVSAGNIFYIFPDVIIVRRATLLEKSPELPVVSAPWIVTRFSWGGLLIKRQVIFPNIGIYHPRIHISRFSYFLQSNSERIAMIVKTMPRMDCTFELKNAHWYTGESPRAAEGFLSDVVFAVRGNSLLGSLTLREKTEGRGSSPPLTGRFRGTFSGDEINIAKVSFRNETLHSNLWGNLDDGLLQLKGFLMVDRPTDKPDPAKIAAGRLRRELGTFLSGSGDVSVPVKGTQTELHLLDINSRVKLEPGRIALERLYFTLNNIPVSFNGVVSFSDPPALELSGAFYLSQAAIKGAEGLKEADLKLSGIFEEGRFRSNGVVNFVFDIGKTTGYSPQGLEFRFEDSDLGLHESGRMAFRMGQAQALYRVNNNDHKLSFEDLTAFAGLQPGRFKLLELIGPFYDGHLQGRLWMDTDASPVEMTAVVTIDGADANKMDEFLVHFAKVEGRLSSRMNFQNHPQPVVSGEIGIRDGVLEDFTFFQWLAETFQLPSLRHVDFERISTDFTVDIKSAALDDILLESPQLLLNGYFHVDKSNLVSSRVSLSFGRKLLQESPKLRTIARLVGPGLKLLTFDFQLSGDQNAMNFQWLQSDFKRRIEDRIPNFIERHIEKQIDDIMSGAPGQN